MPLAHEEMYVIGALNDWRYDDLNRMTYNAQLGGYLCQLLLKQGYYNFLFVTADPDTGLVSNALTEGNHWETENLYRVYFYYYNALKGYDELIGYATCNAH